MAKPIKNNTNIPHKKLGADQRATLDQMFDWIINDSPVSAELSDKLPKGTSDAKKIDTLWEMWDIGQITILDVPNEDGTFDVCLALVSPNGAIERILA